MPSEEEESDGESEESGQENESNKKKAAAMSDLCTPPNDNSTRRKVRNKSNPNVCLEPLYFLPPRSSQGLDQTASTADLSGHESEVYNPDDEVSEVMEKKYNRFMRNQPPSRM